MSDFPQHPDPRKSREEQLFTMNQNVEVAWYSEDSDKWAKAYCRDIQTLMAWARDLARIADPED